MEGRVMAHDQGTPANNCGRCGQRDWCVCRVRPSWIGALTVVCQFCRARFFPGEKIDCCESGKIRFPPATPLPAAVLKMFPNNAHSDPAFVKLWRKHSRKFNTAFAFASTVMKRAVLNGHGPPVVIATGQVFRILWDGTDTAETRAHPAFAQIYYYTQELSSRLIQRKGLVLRIELVTSNAAIFDHSSATSMSASALQIVPTVSKLSFGVKRAGRLRAVKIIPVSSEEESPDEDSGEKQPPLKVMKCADPSSSSPMECTSSVLKRNRPQSDVESGIVKVKREDGREEMLYPSSVSNSKPIISSSSLKRTRSGAESEEYVLSSGEEDMRGLRKRHLKFPDGTSADPEAIELSGDEEGPPQNEFVPPFATVIFDECQVMQDNILHRTRTTALSADASGVRDLMQNRTRDQNVMVMVKFGTEIDTIKMLCLMEFEQLNDEVINVYFRMIELRSRLSESRHKVSVLNTFLMNSLLQNQNGFDYNRVRNYGKKLNGNRMGMVWGYDGTAATEQSRIDLLLIPVHLGNHWILLSVAFKSRTIYCFDSLGDCQSSKLFYALAYLEHEFQKYGLPFYTEQWTQVNSRGQGPQQQNFLDCGVFMTMMADYISLDLEPNYRCVCPGTAEDHRKLPKEFCTCGSRAAIQCFRDHMVLSIAHGKIL